MPEIINNPLSLTILYVIFDSRVLDVELEVVGGKAQAAVRGSWAKQKETSTVPARSSAELLLLQPQIKQEECEIVRHVLYVSISTR